MSRTSERKEYDHLIRLNLLEGDADKHEEEVAGIKSTLQRLTWSIASATVTLAIGIILWSLNNVQIGL